MNTKQLRQKILDLAIKGKLVPQNPNDEPAGKLLERIREEKEQLIKDGKIKKDKNKSYIFVGDDKLHYEKFVDGSVVCIGDEIPFKIPENWAWCRLKEVCTKIVDGAHNPPRGENVKTEYIMASSTNINNDRLVELEKVRCLSKKNYIKENQRTDLRKGDILLTTVGTLGRSCVYNNDLNICFQRSVSVISTLIHNFYLKNFFDSDVFQQKINTEATGTAQKGFYLNQLSDVLIPIPPQSEQIRISSTVQELLEIIEAIENNKIDLSKLIKQTKSKVLDLAIKGKLVPQDPNDESADILLEKIREEKENLIKEGKLKYDKNETFIFKNSADNSYYEKMGNKTICIDNNLPFKIPDSWRWCRLKNVGQYKKGPFGSTLTKSIFVPKSENTIKVYEQKNAIQKNASLGSYYITNEYYESKMKSFTVFPGEIIVSCAGTIGETYILPSNIEKGIINQALMRICLTKNMNVYYFLNYFDFILKREAIENSQGTAIKNIPPFDVLKEMYIAIPPFDEQNRIVKKIKSIFTQLDTIHEIFLQ